MNDDSTRVDINAIKAAFAYKQEKDQIESYRTAAKVAYQLYTSFCEAGFSDEQALNLIIGITH